MTPRRAHAERRAARRAPSSAPTRAGAIDIGAACTGFLSGARARRRPDRERAAPSTVLVIGAELLSRLHRPRRPRHRRAVRRRRRRGRAWPRRRRRPDRPGRARLPTAPRSRDHRRAASDLIRGWTATTPSARPSTACPRRRVEAATRAGLDARRHRPLRLPPGQRAASSTRGRRAPRASIRSASLDSIDRYGNTSAASIPIALADAREDGLLAPRRHRAARRLRRRLHLGRRRRSSGGPHEPEAT